ncbi:hypothetical protein RGCCGE502_22000 [Rhizobium grahamii CCGE 502]|nr:hypothetical protein RGCCGE502_22000 [Rhizobium grahamii CCGE 502]
MIKSIGTVTADQHADTSFNGNSTFCSLPTGPPGRSRLIDGRRENCRTSTPLFPEKSRRAEDG